METDTWHSQLKIERQVWNLRQWLGRKREQVCRLLHRLGLQNDESEMTQRQLITQDEKCPQTLVLHIVNPICSFSIHCFSDSSYLAQQEETSKSIALAKTKAENASECVFVAWKTDEQLLRFSLRGVILLFANCASLLQRCRLPTLFRYCTLLWWQWHEYYETVSATHITILQALTLTCQYLHPA